MANVLIEETTMTAIADAIRTKTGSTDSLKPGDMSAAIEGMYTGFPNGTKWTQSNVTEGLVYTFKYVNDRWIVGLKYSDVCNYYSFDGKEWLPIEGIDSYFYQVHYFKGLYLGFTLYDWYYSTDGVTWTVSKTLTCTPKDIASNDEVCVLHTSEGSMYSLDGITWAETTTNDGSVIEISSVIYKPNTNTFVGVSSKHHYYSTDGIIWNEIITTDGSSLSDLFGNTLYITNNTDNTAHVMRCDNGIYYSEDYIDWMSCQVPGWDNKYNRYHTRVVYTNDRWFILTYSTVSPYEAHVWCSSDGKIWTEGIIHYPDEVDENNYFAVDAVTYGNGIYIASNQPYRYYSLDGIEWFPTVFIGDNNIYYSVPCIYCNGVFSDGAAYSVDGQNWRVIPSGVIGNEKISIQGIKNGVWVSSMRYKGIFYSISWLEN